MLGEAVGADPFDEGGGVAGEEIEVHRVRLADLPAFISKKRVEGVAIDSKLLLLLGSIVIPDLIRDP